MTTSQKTKDVILEKLTVVPHDILCKPMMGEFLLYVDGVHIGGIYDGRVLLKETKANEGFELERVKPYDTAKRTMLYLKDLDDAASVQEIIDKTYQSVPQKRK